LIGTVGEAKVAVAGELSGGVTSYGTYGNNDTPTADADKDDDNDDDEDDDDDDEEEDDEEDEEEDEVGETDTCKEY